MGNSNEHITILDLSEIKKYNQNSIKSLLYPIDDKEMMTINLNEKLEQYYNFYENTIKNFDIKKKKNMFQDY